MSLLDQIVVPRLRRYWVRMALRRVHYADRADKLNRLYRVENAWRMDSAREQARFAWTNELIAAHLAPLETILEVGCAEGHQSQYLSRVCRQLYGIDVSRRAVRRAERRCPSGKFAAADPLGAWPAQMPAKVDLVAACEVIYYVKDIPAISCALVGTRARLPGDLLPGGGARARSPLRGDERLPPRTVLLRWNGVERGLVGKPR
jgi:hypothetical protein